MFDVRKCSNIPYIVADMTFDSVVVSNWSHSTSKASCYGRMPNKLQNGQLQLGC